MPIGSRRSRAGRPDAASRGASRRASAAPRASWLTTASSPSWSIVSRFDDHRLAQRVRRARPTKTRAPTSPNSSAPVIRMPVAASSSVFRRGERRAPRRSRCLSPPTSSPRSRPRPASAPASTASRGRHTPASGTGTVPREPGQRQGRQCSDRHADDPHRHQPSGHRLDLRLGVEVGHDPAAHRHAAARGDQVGVLARRAAKREPAEADPDGQHDEQRRVPRRAPGRAAQPGARPPVSSGSSSSARPPRPAPKTGKPLRLEGSEGEALALDLVPQRFEVVGDEVARGGRGGRARPRAASARTRCIVCSSEGMAGRVRRRRPAFHPSWPAARARRSWRARPWRSRP